MNELMDSMSLMVLLTGAILVLTMLMRHALSRTLVPPLVGYLLLGFGLRLLHEYTALLPYGHEALFAFLGNVGLVTLLFRVGLESNLSGLMEQFAPAGLISLVNIFGSAAAGFLVSRYLLDFSAITSLIIAVAFTATSVGVSVQVWKQSEALVTPQGNMLLDLAEIDDICAVVLMALLFTILPAMHQGAEQGHILLNVGTTAGWFTLKFGAFLLFCLFFGKYLEQPISRFLRRFEQDEGYMLSITGFGFVIAAFAGMLGFSLAIGAFFAGLLFSRDPEAVRDEAPFVPIYDFFSPFFFIVIGLGIDPAVLLTSLELGLVLLVFAILAKLLTAGLPAWALRDSGTGLLVGASMVPRAEITMVIMEQGTHLGDWAVTEEVFSAMVIACAATCLLGPIAIHTLLNGRFNPRETS
ncbi:cation:proton antiporter [Salidesulfovibrio brasiliensis]